MVRWNNDQIDIPSGLKGRDKEEIMHLLLGIFRVFLVPNKFDRAMEKKGVFWERLENVK